MPSKRMVSMGSRCHAGLDPASTVVCTPTWIAGRARNDKPFLFRFPGVLHILDHVELHVVELAVLLLDLADIDVVHDVARLGINEHRAARALEDLALHGVEQGL